MYFLYWYLHCVPQTKPKLVYTHTSQQHSKQLARLSLTSIIPTSFPRQDLKTSIAVEFIQVVRGNFGCSVVVSVMLSDCNPFVFFSACSSLPAFLWPARLLTVSLSVPEVSSRQKFSLDSSFLPPAHLYICLWRMETGKERRRWRRDGSGCQQAVSVTRVSTFLLQTILPFSSLSLAPPWSDIVRKSSPPTTHKCSSVMSCVVS